MAGWIGPLLDFVTWLGSLLLANLKWILYTAVPGLLAFLGWVYYWDNDRRAENFDESCRGHLQEDNAFRALRDSPHPEIIVTSDSIASRARTPLKRIRGEWRDSPYKIVVLDTESLEERKKEVIFEQCREIPGKNIIDSELLAALRNYYAYKLALKEEGEGSNVTHHFREKFEQYEYSSRVRELAKPDHYQEITLGESGEVERRTLDDVFLRILRGAENHCLGPIQDVEKKEEAIEERREFMMYLFWGLYIREVRGLETTGSLDHSDCVNLFRVDVRETDHIGYWLLDGYENGQTNIDRFKNIGWKVEDALEEYWGAGNFDSLYPHGESIPEIEEVGTPFIVFKKDLAEFEGGPIWTRIKEDPRYRRKEEYRQ